MKKLLYIGMDLHKRTGSVDFLLKLLERNYDITFCLVDVFSEDPYTVFSDVEENDFDVLVCFQVIPPRELLDRYFCFKQGTFFPMYDGCPSVKAIERWFPYRDFQIISFCRILAEQLKRIGFSSHFIQYFPKPPSTPEWGEPDGIFFWNRRENINIRIVEKLFSNFRVGRVHVHKALDPECNFIPPSEQCSWRIQYSDWYETREEMSSDMLLCAYYIAPRHEEGIGMSFLEAMAMGRCVIAPDNPTMNEYIEHGRTGFLYNEKKPQPLSFGEVKDIQKNSYEYMVEGFDRWESEKYLINEWLLESPEISLSKMIMRLIFRFFRKPKRVLKVLRSELNKGMY